MSAEPISLPTPFRKREKYAKAPREADVVPVSKQAVHVCMFPGCKEKVSMNGTPSGSVQFAVGVDRGSSSSRKSSDVLSFKSCAKHSHLMKGRKVKKKIAFQQHSHMKNLFSTLMHRMNASIASSLRGIEPASEKAA
jgi:hypothetical protein